MKIVRVDYDIHNNHGEPCGVGYAYHVTTDDGRVMEVFPTEQDARDYIEQQKKGGLH